jgi:lipid A 3-O-deacylase
MINKKAGRKLPAFLLSASAYLAAKSTCYLFMRLQRYSLFFCLSLFSIAATAQDSLQTGSFFRFEIDNDALQIRAKNISDRYYTSGLRLSHLGNVWARWPTNRLLLKLSPRAGQSFARLYEFNIGQEIYTPFDKLTRVRPIYPTDRPYCGFLYLSWGLTTTDAEKGRRLTSALTLGAIGPIALAAQTQASFHTFLNETYPAGWDTQFNNDPIISYSALYEGRLVPTFSPNIDLIGFGEGMAGLLGNQIGIGGTIRLGVFADYFGHPGGFYSRSDPRFRRKLQAFVVLSGRFRGLTDNSLLQGGWFNGKNNFYALPAVEMNHFYNQGDFSFVLAYRSVRLEFTQSIRTPEITGGLHHQWGRIGLTVGKQ